MISRAKRSRCDRSRGWGRYTLTDVLTDFSSFPNEINEFVCLNHKHESLAVDCFGLVISQQPLRISITLFSSQKTKCTPSSSHTTKSFFSRVYRLCAHDIMKPLRFFQKNLSDVWAWVNPGSADIHLPGFKKLEMIKIHSTATLVHADYLADKIKVLWGSKA